MEDPVQVKKCVSFQCHINLYNSKRKCAFETIAYSETQNQIISLGRIFAVGFLETKNHKNFWIILKNYFRDFVKKLKNNREHRNLQKNNFFKGENKQNKSTIKETKISKNNFTNSKKRQLNKSQIYKTFSQPTKKKNNQYPISNNPKKPKQSHSKLESTFLTTEKTKMLLKRKREIETLLNKKVKSRNTIHCGFSIRSKRILDYFESNAILYNSRSPVPRFEKKSNEQKVATENSCAERRTEFFKRVSENRRKSFESNRGFKIRLFTPKIKRANFDEMMCTNQTTKEPKTLFFVKLKKKKRNKENEETRQERETLDQIKSTLHNIRDEFKFSSRQKTEFEMSLRERNSKRRSSAKTEMMLKNVKFKYKKIKDRIFNPFRVSTRKQLKKKRSVSNSFFKRDLLKIKYTSFVKNL